MKRFLGTFVTCLVIVEVFLLFGGWMLFDFSRHYFLTGASIAFLLSVLVSVWQSQEERIGALEKRVRDLGERVWTLENPEHLKDSENKENDQ